MWITEVVTHSFWFFRFLSGLHMLVGEVKKRDKAVAIDIEHDAIIKTFLMWNGKRQGG
jgi:hypothetical protein